MLTRKKVKSKKIGKVYEGAWEIIESMSTNTKTKHTNYVLKNIYNGRLLVICDSQLLKIEKGESSISKVIRRRMF